MAGPAWWQRAVFYEIYPLSFQDSDGDGKGDLPGLIARLDHLAWLGVDAVWLSPVQPSPMADFTYDISDFTGVDPVFGTIDDFARLRDGLHDRGIRLVLDFVPNHTSDRHPWFRAARRSRDDRKRDWYVWADPGPDGGPPNNWLSRFGGAAWEWEEATGQYYYHAFLKQQPDLNWRNPELRAAVHDAMRFWLGWGIDGFRIDASAVLLEDARLRDDPPDREASEATPPPDRLKRIHTDDLPETLDLLADIRALADAFPDRVLLGEVQGATERIGRFYGRRRPIFHLPLNFCLLDTSWQASDIAAAIDEYLGILPQGGWPDWVLGGHDKERIATRVGQAQARVAAMLLMTLPGTPIFFAGDEIGMEKVPIPSEEALDPFERRVPGYGLNRDPERSPMRWDAGPNAGFTTGKPWLPIGPDIESRNVAVQREEPRSILALYRRLIALRRAEPALRDGRYQRLRADQDVLAFIRATETGAVLVALNLGGRERRIVLPGAGELLLSTHLDCDSPSVSGQLSLRRDEGLVVRLNS